MTGGLEFKDGRLIGVADSIGKSMIDLKTLSNWDNRSTREPITLQPILGECLPQCGWLFRNFSDQYKSNP